MPTTRTNAIDLLTDDHRRVDRLFEEYERDPLDASRKRIVDEITKELSIHAAIEEQVFYPAVKQTLGSDGIELVDEALQEHLEVKELLALLQDMDHMSREFDERVRALIRNVREHVDEEEGEIFPMFREAIDGARLEEIGVALGKAKKIAPTRPRSHAPTRRPANDLAGTAAGAADRLRDADDMSPEHRSAVKTGLKIAGFLATATGVIVSAVKFVQSRRKPPTRIERLRGIASDVGGKAMQFGGRARELGGKITASQMQQAAGKAWMAGGKAKQLGGKAVSAGADAVRSLRKRAS